MDILNLILAGNGINGLKSSGGIGYTETQSASFTIPLTGDVLPDVTLMNMGWKWFSNLTPTQEEFLDGVLSLKNYKGEVISSHSISTPGLNASVVATATGAYCIRLEIGVFIVSNVLENELGTLPKTGMYYFTGMVAEDTRGGTFVFDFPNKVHPIDPKYIPGAVLPVVEISTMYAEGNPLSTEEGTQFDVAIAKSKSVLVALPIDESGIVVPVLVYANNIDDFTALFGWCGTTPIAFYKDPDSGAWMMGG